MSRKSRRVKHKCSRSGGDDGGFHYPCPGTEAKWSGSALFCVTCGLWQRDRYPTRKSERKEIRKKKVEVKTQPFDFGFELAPGFIPEPEPEWSSSPTTNMVLAMKYRSRVKAAHDKYRRKIIIDPEQVKHTLYVGQSKKQKPVDTWVWPSSWMGWPRDICLEHGNALPCDECDDD